MADQSEIITSVSKTVNNNRICDWCILANSKFVPITGDITKRRYRDFLLQTCHESFHLFVAHLSILIFMA